MNKSRDTSKRDGHLYDGKDEPFGESTSPWEIAKIEANAIKLLTDEEVRSATREDDVLSLVTEALEHGPKISEDLCVDDGIITKNGMNLQNNEKEYSSIQLYSRARLVAMHAEGCRRVGKIMRDLYHQWYDGKAHSYGTYYVTKDGLGDNCALFL